MASYGHHSATSAPSQRPPAVAYAAPAHPHNAQAALPQPPPLGHPAAAAAAVPAAPSAAAPAGTFAPGTKIQVGKHRVVVQKYLSEGGFAHVYLVTLARPIDDTDVAVLKRVAVPDRESLQAMRTEVETMKRLKGHRAIVTYFDSHASELRGGGYEVFLLMEYCNGGGLIDFMNTRLQHRLTEPEILKIFTDVAEGVACMHYLKPPLLHRDLKVENVLITVSGGGARRFKLCDFGSTAPPRPAPTTVVECRLMDEDVQKHTTLQYRSPEMVDVYRKQRLDEKSDIWALGVLLYKLCYYTTPFEEQGQLAILNASFRYPSYPVFSDRLRKLIASMLRESQDARPNIYQVLREACAMQGREVPIQDIYSGLPSSSDDRASPSSSAVPTPQQPPPAVGAVYVPAPVPQRNAIPDVVPMRRGRPPAAATPAAPAAAATIPAANAFPSPSPMRVAKGDPFAALDTTVSPRIGNNGDELSTRFPTLDQFSLLHDHGAPFDFGSPTPPLQGAPLGFGDEPFTSGPIAPAARPDGSRPKSVAVAGHGPVDYNIHKSPTAPPKAEMSRAQAIISNNPELQAISDGKPSTYVSTGTMTTPPPPPSDDPMPSAGSGQPDHPFEPGSELNMARRVYARSSQGNLQQRNSPFSPQPPLLHRSSSSRPSLESNGRAGIERSSAWPRPSSTVIDGSAVQIERVPASGTFSPNATTSTMDSSPPLGPLDDTTTTNVESNVDFLRGMEESDPKRKDKGLKQGKRGSLSLAGTKNMLAGRFGDAFKRFEGGGSGGTGAGSQERPFPPRTPSPLKELERRTLTPVAGSEATDGRSDDGGVEITDDLSPEMRRELERLQLADEERRVEAAQDEYRQRLAQKDAQKEYGAPTATGSAPVLPKSIGGVSRAISIQNRVQSLLSEEQRTSSNVQRTAQGYGKYTDPAVAAAAAGQDKRLPDLPRDTRGSPNENMGEPSKPSAKPQGALASHGVMASIPSQPGGAPPPVKPSLSGKPAAPRKPVHLNSLPTGGRQVSPSGPAPSAAPPLLPASSAAADMASSVAGGSSAGDTEEYIQAFSKRYPSLGKIDLVERDFSAEPKVDK